MDRERLRGIVYTETVVHAPPAQYAADAPYQLAIVDLGSGRRLTVRIGGKEMSDRVQVGDRVEFAEERDGVSFFQKIPDSSEPLATEMSPPLV